MSQPGESYSVVFSRDEIEALIECIGEPLNDDEISARQKLLTARREEADDAE